VGVETFGSTNRPLMVGLTLKEVSKLNKISSEAIHDYISSYQYGCQYSIYLAPGLQTTHKIWITVRLFYSVRLYIN